MSRRPAAVQNRPSKTIQCLKKAEPAKPKEWTLPALSLTLGGKQRADEYLAKYKGKTVRRNAPPGEDLNRLREVLASLKDQEISVQEFIRLVGPYTGDSGDAMRAVMNDDLNSFRKLAKKVYETITQDNSDVLLNQQLQLSEYYKEKKGILQYRMMNNIEEIYGMAPKFDFDKYEKEGEKYLIEIFPMPAELVLEPEEIEMMKRQAAYHRLQWLRSEGERLNEENKALKCRLAQMKQQHRDEQMRLIENQRLAEAKKEALEDQEADKMETLEMLNESIEKTIVDQETTLREKADVMVGQGAKRKVPGMSVPGKIRSKTKLKKKPKWNEIAAKDIEARMHEAQRRGEAGRSQKQTSPFHYSPPRDRPHSPQTPQEACETPEDEGARGVTIPHRRKVGGAPREAWGGFY